MKKHPELEVSTTRISELGEAFAEHFVKMVRSDGKIYTFDFFVAGVSDRSIAIARSFSTMVADRNYVASTILLRSQIDTLFRVFGMSLVKNPLDCSERIFNGVRYDMLTDRDGKKLKDFYLKQKIGEIHEWLPVVYENSSGFVHMSKKNIFTVFDQSGEDNSINLAIGNGGSHLPIEVFQELAAAFVHIMQICLDMLRDLSQIRPNALREL